MKLDKPHAILVAVAGLNALVCGMAVAVTHGGTGSEIDNPAPMECSAAKTRLESLSTLVRMAEDEACVLEVAMPVDDPDETVAEFRQSGGWCARMRPQGKDEYREVGIRKIRLYAVDRRDAVLFKLDADARAVLVDECSTA